MVYGKGQIIKELLINKIKSSQRNFTTNFTFVFRRSHCHIILTWIFVFYLFSGEATDDQPFVAKNEKAGYETNLYLYAVSYMKIIYN